MTLEDAQLRALLFDRRKGDSETERTFAALAAGRSVAEPKAVFALYSLLEVGCFVGNLPEAMPSEISAEATRVFERVPRSRCPELVQRFERRILGDPYERVHASDRSRARALYRSFLEIDRAIARDPHVQAFLIHHPALQTVCREPALFGHALARAEDVPEDLAMATQGLIEYLNFALRLDTLLAHSRRIAGLVEHFWLHFASTVGRVDVENILAELETWPGGMARTHVAPLRAALKRLENVDSYAPKEPTRRRPELAASELPAILRRAFGSSEWMHELDALEDSGGLAEMIMVRLVTRPQEFGHHFASPSNRKTLGFELMAAVRAASRVIESARHQPQDSATTEALLRAELNRFGLPPGRVEVLVGCLVNAFDDR